MKLYRKAALLAMLFRFKGGAWSILAAFFYDLYLTLLGKKGPHSRRFLLSLLSTIVVFLTLLIAFTGNFFVAFIDLIAISTIMAIERTF